MKYLLPLLCLFGLASCGVVENNLPPDSSEHTIDTAHTEEMIAEQDVPYPYSLSLDGYNVFLLYNGEKIATLTTEWNIAYDPERICEDHEVSYKILQSEWPYGVILEKMDSCGGYISDTYFSLPLDRRVTTLTEVYVNHYKINTVSLEGTLLTIENGYVVVDNEEDALMGATTIPTLQWDGFVQDGSKWKKTIDLSTLTYPEETEWVSNEWWQVKVDPNSFGDYTVIAKEAYFYRSDGIQKWPYVILGDVVQVGPKTEIPFPSHDEPTEMYYAEYTNTKGVKTTGYIPASNITPGIIDTNPTDTLALPKKWYYKVISDVGEYYSSESLYVEKIQGNAMEISVELFTSLVGWSNRFFSAYGTATKTGNTWTIRVQNEWEEQCTASVKFTKYSAIVSDVYGLCEWLSEETYWYIGERER